MNTPIGRLPLLPTLVALAAASPAPGQGVPTPMAPSASAPTSAPGAQPPPAAAAQPPRPVSISVAVNNVFENRTNVGTGTLQFSLSVFTQGVGATTTLRSVNLTRALDNEDREIPPAPASSNIGYRLTTRAPTANPLLTGTAALKSPRRSASAVRVLEGTVDLYIPPSTPVTPSIVKNVFARPAERIESPALGAHDIELRYFDLAAWNAFRAKTAFPDEINFGTDDIAVLWGTDPRRAILAWELQDPNGAPLPNRNLGAQRNGSEILTYLTQLATLPPDTHLAFIVAPPESIRTLPFKLENIPLP